MLTTKVLHLLDNATPYTVARIQGLGDSFGWEVIDHLPYSPGIAQNDIHFFLSLEFGNNEEVKVGVSKWLRANGRIL